MTNSEQRPKKPSPSQQRLLRELALERGGTFSPPATFAQADEEIKRLKKIKRTSRADRRREIRAVQDAMAPAPRRRAGSEREPSARQLALLQRLAAERRVECSEPGSSQEASEEIERLLAIDP
jgi:hypothetical protein